MSEKGEDWLRAIAEREAKSTCMDCSTALSIMCILNVLGGRTIIPLSPDMHGPVDVPVSIEQCREHIIFQRK